MRLPALRARRRDSEALGGALLDPIGRRSGPVHKSQGSDALDRLLAPAWAGPICALRHGLAQAGPMTDDLPLTPVNLAQGVGVADGGQTAAVVVVGAWLLEIQSDQNLICLKTSQPAKPQVSWPQAARQPRRR